MIKPFLQPVCRPRTLKNKAQVLRMERKTLIVKTLKEHDMESEDEEDIADYRQGDLRTCLA